MRSIAIKSAGIHPGILNIGNSAALLAGQARTIAKLAARFEMKPSCVQASRSTDSFPNSIRSSHPQSPSRSARRAAHLRPVLTWKSQVVSVRSVEPGTVVGYNGTFVATEPMRLALVAAGYADGLDRKLGNHFSLARPRPARAPRRPHQHGPGRDRRDRNSRRRSRR